MRFFTTLYLLLLAYIIIALVFWEVSLQKQSGQIFAQEVETLRSRVDSAVSPALYNEQLQIRNRNLKSRTLQYIGEGSTFLIVIILGAAVVYSSIRRSIILSRQQNNFMLSVTHELKSPIAAMKLNMQTLERHRLSEDQRSTLVERCIIEADRLNDLCNNILFVSQIDGGQYKPTRENFNLSELAMVSVLEYTARYPQRFVQEIDPDCYIAGDRVMLQIVINNLLENAVKYTPKDKPVLVTLHTERKTAVIQVRDQGAGIPDIEKKRIFHKFYRVGNEKSRSAKGTGLGLYLANKVVQQHKGSITVKDNTPSGSVFVICLPA